MRMIYLGLVVSVAISHPAVADDSGAKLVTSEPNVATMRVAVPKSSKAGVPVDVRYALPDSAQSGQPMSLDIAVIPRVDGENLQVTLLGSDTMPADKEDSMTVANAKASTAYRKLMQVTPQRAAAGQLRVMVSMAVAEARYSSLFVIALPSD